MAIVLDRPQPGAADPATPSEPRQARTPSARLVAVAAAASLAAGAIHAAAIAAYSGDRQAVWVFLSLAVVQLGWGGISLTRPARRTTVAGALIAAAALGGWVVAKTQGISFIDGLEGQDPPARADALAAALALVTVVTALLALVPRRLVLPRGVAAVAAAGIVVVAAAGVTGAIDHTGEHTNPDGTPVVIAAVPPRPFDPERPIDLGGVEGVSPQQQARAENLLASTVLRLPQWSEPEYAETKGFRSIGDGGTGEEHYVNPEFMANDTILDPDEPESLVYDTTVTPKKLVAAMFMLTPGTDLGDAPDIGGALTQWHIHNNLCFNTGGRVAGLTDGEGDCSAPLVKGPETPMIHVWITPHPCGPFSALEGIAGGQIEEGETVACNKLHGS